MHHALPGPHDTALVWLKRDLRLADHAPLTAAQGFRRALAVFIIEPEWLRSPECDSSHVAFALECLQALRDQGLPVLVRQGSAVAVLEALRATYGVTHLLSHEETGPGWSWTRDKAVAAWCRATGVQWSEVPQTGVVRRLATRNGWAGRWEQRMRSAALPAVAGLPPLAAPHAESSPALGTVTGLPTPGGLVVDPLPTLPKLKLPPHGKTLQAGGEAAAHGTLQSFLHRRGQHYRRALSSPLTAQEGCSRLSPHLAFGTVSMRQVHQATEQRIQHLQGSASPEDRAFAHALRGFAGRLRWHCHFMQKLEDEPDIEFRNFARSADGLRPGDEGVPMSALDDERLAAWCEGRTGFPMVDACMRSLRATGWLNFRMRAMLVSFAAYHLGLHWRAPGLHLARQFLDFEPGIHWSQMQMQSGTTGINTLRIYSPAKQAREHDPRGEFVRRWVPEWGLDAYPAPIVDEAFALRQAKDLWYGLRGTPQARTEANEIQQRHGSRKSGLPPSGRGAVPRSPRARRKAPDASPVQAAQTIQRDLFE